MSYFWIELSFLCMVIFQGTFSNEKRLRPSYLFHEAEIASQKSSLANIFGP